MKKNTIHIFATGILAGVLISYASAVGAWTGPTGTPPGSNVPAPVNIGSDSQIKDGALGVSGFLDTGTSLFTGMMSIIASTGNGSIHIGASDPSSSTGGAWWRNDSVNTVFSTWVGDLFIGYGGNASKKIRIGNGSGGAQFTGSAPVGSFVLDGSGNVGVGTTTPSNKLSVYGGRMELDNAAGGQSAIQFSSAGAEKSVLYRPAGSANLSLWGSTYSGDIMTWNTTNGKVGIGTTAPSEKLEVNGKIKSTNLQVTNLGGTGSTLVEVDNSGNFYPAVPSAQLYLINRTDCNTVGTTTASYPKGNLGYQSLTTYSHCWAGAGGTTAYPNTYIGAIYQP